MRSLAFAVALMASTACTGAIAGGAPGPAAPLATANAPGAPEHIDGGLQWRSGDVIVRVTALRDDILRVRIGRNGALPEDASWAVLAQARKSSTPLQVAADGAGGWRASTGAVVVQVKADLSLTITDAQGRVLLADAAERPLTLDSKGFTLRKALPAGEHIFGLGDKPGSLDRRGQSFAMWNTDAYGWQESSDPLYKSIPFFIGADDQGRSYGVLLDNTFRSWFDFGRTDDRVLTMGAADGPIDYYVISGPEPKQVVEGYAWLTGPTPMPPLWALGFQQSRYSYMSDAEVRGIADRLRREKIPADAIYLDIDYQDRNRPFTVNAKTFPDLPKLTADLKAEGVKLVVITDLHIAHAPNEGYKPYDTGAAGDHFVKTPEGKTYVGEVWPGPAVFPDFTRASTRAWWGGLYKEFHDAGVAGFWNDMNEPAVFNTPGHTMPLDVQSRIDEPGFKPRVTDEREVHNIFGLENSRATHDGLLNLAPDERPFVLTRASYAGGQRYAATWTGDNSSTWNHLRIATPQLLSLGLSGFAMSGADVGGFAGSPPADLLTRWIEVAAFTPLFRDHAAKGTRPHEVWVDGPEHLAMRKRFIEERYRLMPYLYALADETARTGLPMMRPLFLEFPKEAAVDKGDAFLLGPDLMVGPPPEGETLDPFDVLLPGGGWYDYWTGRKVAGDASHETPALDRLPVFVRPGAILPRQPLVQSTAERPDGPLELRVYPGPACSGALYWDDGISRKRENGAFLRQAVHCEIGPKGVSVRFDKREGSYAPWWKSLKVVVYGWDKPAAAARLNGKAVGARVDAGAGVVEVALPDEASAAVLTLE